MWLRSSSISNTIASGSWYQSRTRLVSFLRKADSKYAVKWYDVTRKYTRRNERYVSLIVCADKQLPFCAFTRLYVHGCTLMVLHSSVKFVKELESVRCVLFCRTVHSFPVCPNANIDQLTRTSSLLS